MPDFALRCMMLTTRAEHAYGRRAQLLTAFTQARTIRKAMPVYDFTVTVRTQYLPEQSDPSRTNYVFTYSITIKNTGNIGAQLIARHWVITDANNHVDEVRGLGVVGHQPLLQPGEQFEYTSGTQLATPQGSMVGEYFCVAEDGHRFEVKIPEFVLSLPRTLH
jgi:ApaG protein